jgi:hypothetical protein
MPRGWDFVPLFTSNLEREELPNASPTPDPECSKRSLRSLRRGATTRRPRRSPGRLEAQLGVDQFHSGWWINFRRLKQGALGSGRAHPGEERPCALRQTLTLADARVGVHAPATTRTLGVEVAADLCAAVGLWATEASSVVRRAAGACTHSLVSTELLRSSGAREGNAAGGAEARGRSEEHAVVTALGIGLTGVARCLPNPAGCHAHALAAIDGAAVLRVE